LRRLPPLDPETPLAERKHDLRQFSYIWTGSGFVVAIATETGRISQLMEQSTNLETLTRKIHTSKTLLYVILG